MAREKEDYRINLERLLEKFGSVEVIGLKEVCEYLRCDKRTVIGDKKFPLKQLGGKYIVPLTGFARWLS